MGVSFAPRCSPPRPDANAACRVAFLPPVDLSSTFIPVDEDEEEEEQTYDDIEGVSGPPVPLPGAVHAPHSGEQRGGKETVEDNDDEEEDDIYEQLPGMRKWLTRMQRSSNSHSWSYTQKPSRHSVRQINAVSSPASRYGPEGFLQQEIHVMISPGCEIRVARYLPSLQHPRRITHFTSSNTNKLVRSRTGQEGERSLWSD